MKDQTDKVLNEFCQAMPFPHLVRDNFMPPSAVRAFVAALPERNDRLWKPYRNEKRGVRELWLLSGTCRRFIRDYLDFIKGVVPQWTGYEDVIPDVSYAGAGIHAVLQGGSLGVHVDFNGIKKIQVDRKLKTVGPLYRVLNTFLYLNEDWNDEWGGGLSLYDPPVWPNVILEVNGDIKDARPGRCVKTIAPTFNRFVMFESSEQSWHGHPQPLRCPANRERLSLAVYWYTRERPAWFRGQHSTVYVK